MSSFPRLATVDGDPVNSGPRRRRRRASTIVQARETALWSARAASCSAQHVMLAVDSPKALGGKPLDSLVVAGLAIILEREARAAASYADNAVTALEMGER